MHIRQIFHTEDDLRQRFDQRFVDRWKGLLSAYKMNKKDIDISKALRAASMAFVFFTAATDGDSMGAGNFGMIVNGESQETVLLDDQPVRMDDDSTKMLIWDTAALMLDADDSLLGQAQWAFDLVGKNVWLAYKLPVSSVREEKINRNPFSNMEVKTVDSAVPLIPQEVMEWMMNHAKETDNQQYAGCVKSMISDNILAHYHPEVYNKLMEMQQACRPCQEFNFHDGAQMVNRIDKQENQHYHGRG